MLKSINPLLTGSLLQLLDEMGHGDKIALVDRNFPAYRYQVPVIDLRGADTAAAAEALFTVFPLDSFVQDPIQRMEIDGSPAEVNAPSAQLQQLASTAEGREVGMSSVERFEFYEAAKEIYAVIQTGETVGYCCYLLRKGVV